MSKPTVIVYTDGACNPNPGPGGWAALLIYPDRPLQELVGAEAQTTNNRMELRAALEALRALDQPSYVELYTDSQYLRQGITEWLPRWKAQGWQRTGKSVVQNLDLWQALDEQVARHEVVWHWTRGHAGNRLNERVDQLARSALPQASLPVDDEQAVHIFTAVSYLNREKKGGWAVLLRYRDQVKTLGGSEVGTSSNRLHIRSAIEGLNALTRAVPVHLYTTSDYLKNGATIWTRSWADAGWCTRDGAPVKHRDLWEILAALTQKYAVTWHVVGDENTVEEMAQVKRLAVQAARGTSAKN